MHADAGLAAYLSPNALLQSDDSNIETIAKGVVGKESEAWWSAQTLQRWTNDNVRFDPAIAMASEVARDRRGTCFGYSMLLGSLCAPQEFLPACGWDTFTQEELGAALPGSKCGSATTGFRWMALFYSPGAADAARFSFFTSSLEEGTLAQVGSLAQMFGNVGIKILEYSVEGRRVVVPEDAKLLSSRTILIRTLGLVFRL